MNHSNKQMNTVKPTIPEVRHNIKAEVQTLFPTANSLNEVVELGNSRLPITNPNELLSLLCMYHNTLLKQVNIK